jgi:hypothetical protein
VNNDIGRSLRDGLSSLRDGAATASPPKASIPSAWPLCGHAPGYYSGKCHSCGKEFQGAKRSFECLECAAASANWLLATGRAKLTAVEAHRDALLPVLDALEALLEVHEAMGAGQSYSARRARTAIASAIEARRAATLGAVHESAGAQHDAQPLPPQSDPIISGEE